jgi:hypothetical protein
MPQYVLLFVGSDEQMESMPKDRADAAYAAIGKWWAELATKGVIKGGEQLAPPKTATTVRRVNGRVTVSDGPFMESKEHVGGYAMVEAPDLDAAIALAKSWPAGDVEVRPIVEH